MVVHPYVNFIYFYTRPAIVMMRIVATPMSNFAVSEYLWILKHKDSPNLFVLVSPEMAVYFVKGNPLTYIPPSHKLYRTISIHFLRPIPSFRNKKPFGRN